MSRQSIRKKVNPKYPTKANHVGCPSTKHSGHGLGLQISMMTRAGTNTQRGTVNYQYWTNKFNALTEQQKLTFDDRAKGEFDKGRSHNLSMTAGGPKLQPSPVVAHLGQSAGCAAWISRSR